MTTEALQAEPDDWYKDAIIYQAHVKAYADDSGDDEVGDSDDDDEEDGDDDEESKRSKSDADGDATAKKRKEIDFELPSAPTKVKKARTAYFMFADEKRPEIVEAVS